jgi:hypothetical protein
MDIVIILQKQKSIYVNILIISLFRNRIYVFLRLYVEIECITQVTTLYLSKNQNPMQRGFPILYLFANGLFLHISLSLG